MGMSPSNTGSGKTTQPPEPEIGQLKPMAASADGFSVGGGNARTPTTQQEVGQLKPLQVTQPAASTGVDNSNPWVTLANMQYSGSSPSAPSTSTGGGGGNSSTGGSDGFSVGGGGGGYGGGGFGTPGVQGPVNDTSRQRVEQAILTRLEPQFKQDEERMRNQLLSSGLEVGSPAYAAELDRLQRGQNDARQQAILTGGTEESRQVGLNAQLQGQAFGQGLQGAQFDNATRQQMLSELLLQRNTPLNELNSLRTGSQVSMPNFSGYYTNNSAPAPVFDAAQAQGNYDIARSQQEQSGFNSMLGGLATLGGAGIMRFSDLRLKSDVKLIGRTAGGHNLYSWKWKGSSRYDTGVIAQEVQQVRPDAVVKDTSGYLMVDYSRIH